MYRVSDLINLPILESSAGNVVGTVKTIILDTSRMSVYSLICKENKLSKHISMILFEKIIGLDKNRVLIRNNNAVARVKQTDFSPDRFLYFENIIDKVVINNNGDILGAIRDIVFEESDGAVKFYELSEGYIDDITNGRRKVNCSSITKYDANGETFKYDNATSIRIC